MGAGGMLPALGGARVLPCLAGRILEDQTPFYPSVDFGCDNCLKPMYFMIICPHSPFPGLKSIALALIPTTDACLTLGVVMIKKVLVSSKYQIFHSGLQIICSAIFIKFSTCDFKHSYVAKVPAWLSGTYAFKSFGIVATSQCDLDTVKEEPTRR
ncbi:hypothetical protein KP509_20G006600 [Ceratopteris richardii]|uniref:Uncharacterized protein n=1 Tax=Ceratopteris richardii TaxID=49495 RepID=A0A8T2SG03_CERRI|nr:hypothetical protein KP509_20G006600 [Ceratopteris richardii]